MREYSTEELNKMDKQMLVTIVESLQGQLSAISGQLDLITKQLELMNQRSFGRKTEKMDQLESQLSLFVKGGRPRILLRRSISVIFINSKHLISVPPKNV